MVRAPVAEERGQGPGGASGRGKETPFHFSLGTDGRGLVIGHTDVPGEPQGLGAGLPTRNASGGGVPAWDLP